MNMRNILFKKQFPHFKQHNTSDCGPTCLRMIAKHYRQDYSVEMLRRQCHIARNGVNMLGISDAATHIGGFHSQYYGRCQHQREQTAKDLSSHTLLPFRDDGTSIHLFP